MKIQLFFILFVMLGVFSCSNMKPSTLPENEHIYWVNSLKTECVGVAPGQCLQIQRGNELNADAWELFYSDIIGFEYEAGYIYQLIVKEDIIPAEQVPADGSSIRYTLIKMVDKQLDDKLKLNDIWVLESIAGETLILEKRQKRPQLEINLQKMRISGTDGCNNFFGGITTIDSVKLTFGPIATTRMACPNMDITNKFHQHIKRVQTYSIKQFKLYLYDIKGTELFVFKKID